MQQAETKSPSAATEADDSLAILARILPIVTDDGLQLGRPDRPTAFRFALAIGGCCRVHLDAEARILGLQWRPDEFGAAGEGFENAFAGLSGPILLWLRRASPMLVTDRAAIFVGLDGIAIKRAEGQFEYIRAEEILGFADRTCEQPLPLQ